MGAPSQNSNPMGILRAAVEEGRPENVRYRQDQHHALHAALRENAAAICTAITDDSGCSPEEADAEFYLGMDVVKKSYNCLNFEQSLKDEYSVAHGKDNIRRRAAFGLVAIRPSKHSRFLSILAPLVAAIAAGNCCLLEVDGSSKNVDKVLQNVLLALDQDAFQISPSRLDEKALQEINLFVDQTSTSQPSSTKALLSTPQLRTLAIVDRTSDVELAAEAITKARLSSNSTSPYSPDLVIVNEYILEAFAKACLKCANSLASSLKPRTVSMEEKKAQISIEEAEKVGRANIFRAGTTNMTIAEILDRGSPLAQLKVHGQVILLLSSTGLGDSVNSQRSLPPLLACYLFASPSACKFLSEQVSSPATYFNHIPTEILFGPASPQNYTHSLHPRYTPEMFSTPRPQFVTPSNILPASTKLKDVALEKLRPTGQRPGHAVGFFEQGIFTGLGLTAAIVLPILTWGIFAAGKQGWRFVQARLK